MPKLGLKYLLGLSLAALPLSIPMAGNTAENMPQNMETHNMQTTTLPNGLNVIVLPDHRAPVVVHSVWFRAGAIDEPNGKTGIAHMLEHLMFKGTKSMTGKERELIIQKHGAEENAFTSTDYTAYYQKVSTQHLKLMMKMEADRLENLKLAESDFLPERDVVLEERRWRTDSKPINRFIELYNKEHFGQSPYSRPVIGWQKDIENYKLQDALDWYGTYYAPNNATLILAGDVTLDQVLPMIEDTYGKTTSAQTPQRKIAANPLSKDAQTFTQTDETVQVPFWVRSYRVPSATQKVAQTFGNTQDAPALTLLAEILGGSQTGRLYQALVQKQKLADSAGADYNATNAGETSLDIMIQPKPGVTLEKIAKAVDDVVNDFIKNGPTKEELQRAQMGWRAHDVYSKDDLFYQIYDLGTWLMAGGTVETYKTWSQSIQNVELADIKTTAKTYLIPAHTTTGQLVNNTSQLGNAKVN